MVIINYVPSWIQLVILRLVFQNRVINHELVDSKMTSSMSQYKIINHRIGKWQSQSSVFIWK